MPPIFSAVLGLHIAAGFTALLVGVTAMVSRKGEKLHRRSGLVYVWAMVVVFASAVILALYGSDTFLLAIAVLSFFLTFTGYRALGQKTPQQGAKPLDWLVSSVTLLFGLGLLLWGSGVLGLFDFLAVFFGITTVALALGSLRRFRSTPKRGEWFFSHIVGMLAAYIATFTAFAVTNITFLPPVLVWVMPTVIGTLGIILTTRHYRTKMLKGRKLRELVVVRADGGQD